MNPNVVTHILGTHYLAEFFDCDKSKIDDLPFMEKVMIEATALSGSRMIKPFFHQFSPHGISGVIVIAESHFAVHTWPEHGYAAIDLFSCSSFDYRAALDHLRIQLESRHNSVSLVRRGIISPDGGANPSEWERLDIEK